MIEKVRRDAGILTPDTTAKAMLAKPRRKVQLRMPTPEEAAAVLKRLKEEYSYGGRC